MNKLIKNALLRVLSILPILGIALHYSLKSEITLQDIFLAKNTITRASKTEQCKALNNRCRELNLALEFEIDEAESSLQPYIKIRKFKLPIAQKMLEDVYDKLIKNNPYHNKQAHVRKISHGSNLLKKEHSIIKKRRKFIQKKLESLLGCSIEKKNIPHIGVCCSGGGYRAMLCTAGLLKAFDQNGILDCVEYLSALSGSTWALATWMLDERSYSKFHPTLIKRAAEGFIGQDKNTILQEIKDSFPIISEYLIQKIIFREIPSLIDFYGYFLATSLFSSQDSQNYTNVTLSSQRKFIRNGQRPFPLYTAITPHTNNQCTPYSWFEFSPYEVTNSTLQGGVPNWSYGRKFYKGLSTNNAPELPLGFLMALWGSAISVNFQETSNLILEALEPHALFSPFEQFANETVFGAIRAFPARIRNFMSGLTQTPYHKKDWLTVIDAGIDCVLPLPPLLQKQRNIDIIIVCDASLNNGSLKELKRAEQYARKNGLSFPHITTPYLDEKNVLVFDDGPNSNAPVIIYIPLIKNNSYSEQFDPQNEVFLQTFNLWYTKNEAELVSGLMEHTGQEVTELFKKVVHSVIARKNTTN